MLPGLRHTHFQPRSRRYLMAYEMGLTQINASGHNDPTAETLAQTIVMLAKRGERDPVRLEQRAIEIISGPPQDVARSTQT
jgi:hypothetical protein